MIFPDIDPVILSIGPIKIHWYSIAYIMGIIFGFWYIKTLARKQNLALDKLFIDDLFIYTILGIILGGRLGFVMFYDPIHYINNPLEILYTWKGGMSFHGGMIGVILAIIITSRKHKINTWKILDITACAAPVGLFLGRITNFINGELFGRITDSKLGIIFPSGGPFPRHPSQIYEALGEGLLLFLILNYLYLVKKTYKTPGTTSGLFGLFYALIRIAIEFFREPNHNLGYFWQYFTMGQILSCAMIVVAIIILKNTQTEK
ncbi:MAG: prolipoprotein diacylglyceryl transferase [Rickettsiales bacterium]|nr:prolipoprotein diacylglyceryl transferase [Rickettsiales bacterium]